MKLFKRGMLLLLIFLLSSIAAYSLTVKVNYKNNNSWNQVNAHIWGNGGNITGNWPGVIMPSDSSHSGWNSYTLNTTQSEPLSIIFSNNGSNQTANLAIPTGQSEVWYNNGWVANPWASERTIRINFKKNSSWAGTPNVHVWGERGTTDIAISIWPGYTMTANSSYSGWYYYDLKTTIADPLGALFHINPTTNKTGDLAIPTGQSEVWFDGDKAQWVSGFGVSKTVTVHFRNTQDWEATYFNIYSGATTLYNNIVPFDGVNPGWSTYTFTTTSADLNVVFGNGVGINSSAFIMNATTTTEFWFDASSSLSGWMPKKNIKIHVRKPDNWNSAYLYMWPARKTGAVPGTKMIAETDEQLMGWYTLEVTDVEVPFSVKFSDNGLNVREKSITDSNIFSNEVFYDATIDKFLDSYYLERDVKIHFKKSTIWNSTTLKAHVWGEGNPDTTITTWPGELMSAESGHTDWYVYTFKTNKPFIGVRFNDGTNDTMDKYLPGNATEVWYDVTQNKWLDGNPWQMKTVNIYFRNTPDWPAVSMDIYSGTPANSIQMNYPLMQDFSHAGWYSCTVNSDKELPFTVLFKNGTIVTNSFTINSGESSVWFDGTQKLSGWLPSQDLLIHVRKPASWGSLYLYTWPDRKLGALPGSAMYKETLAERDGWYTINVPQAEIDLPIKVSDNGNNVISRNIDVSKIYNGEVWYDALFDKWYSSWAFSTNLTKIKVKVDMSVLWGGDLPTAVYMFAFLNSTETENGKEYYKRVPGLSAQGRYCKSDKFTNNEQNTTGALKLTDEDLDGIYEGELLYDGTDHPGFHTILYIRKDDALNVMHKPMYERKTDVSVDVTDTMWFRTVTIENKVAKIGWNTGKVTLVNNEWNSAWENKTISGFNITDPLEVYAGLTLNLTINATYNHAEPGLTRDVTKYVPVTSNDESIVKVTKDIINGKVVNRKLSGEKVGSTKINVSRSNVIKEVTVNVKAVSETTPFQTVIYKPAKQIAVNDSFVINGAGNYGLSQIKGVNSTTIQNSIWFTDSTNFAESKFSRDSTNLDKWTANSVNDTILIPTERRTNSEILNLSVENNGVTKNMKLPIPMGDIRKNSTGTRFSLSWNEDMNIYNTVYDKKQEILVRISRIESEPDSLIYDLYSKKNPIKKAYIEQGNSNDAAVKEFDSKSSGYIDYLFDAGVSQTRISYDGRSVQYILSSSEKNLYVQNFKPGKYKIQIYTIKTCEDYSVITFEKESPFEITKEDSNYSEDITGSYVMHEINSKKFGQVEAYFISKTKTPVILTKENINYYQTKVDGKILKNLQKVGERKEATGGFEGVLGDVTPNDISVEKDSNFSAVKPPLDIVLCLDVSNSMAQYKDTIKSAWRAFETDVQNRGYNVKFRQIKFWQGQREQSSEWVDTLPDSSFEFKPGSDTWTQEGTYKAVEAGLNVLRDQGRYFSVIDQNGTWGYNTTGNGIPSTKVIIFITDTSTNKDISVNTLEYRVRAESVTLSGVSNIKKDGLLFEDDYEADRTEALYPLSSEEHYYHLKMLLGNRLKLYQLTKDSTKLGAQLKDGMGRISVMDRWKVTYTTPYQEKDSTRRSVDFDVEYDVNGSSMKMVYNGEQADRLYTAPNGKVEILIDNPQTDGKFEIDPSNSSNVIITGKIRELNKNPGYEDSYSEMTGKEIEISFLKNATDTVVDLSEYKIVTADKMGSDGYYRFKTSCPIEKLINSGTGLFDVSAQLKTTTTSAKVFRVSLDNGPPSILSLEVSNVTLAQFWGDMKNTEDGEKIFESGKAEIFSKVKYNFTETFTAVSYGEVLLTSGKRDAGYDGHYAKDGDEISVTAKFLEENFDENNMGKDGKNLIRARFTNMGSDNADWIYGTVTTATKDITPLKGKLLTTTLNGIKIKNSTKMENIVAEIELEAIDNLGRSSKTKLGEIQILKIDNILPTESAGWQSSALKKKADTGVYNAISMIDGKYLTNNSYRVYPSANSTADENCFRAFAVYYDYDSTMSDWGSAGRGDGVGNHDKDLDKDSKKYFFVRAGDGLNSNSGVVNGESSDKNPNLTGHYDDGRYIFRAEVVDKAGNIGIYKTSAVSKELHVDTKAPEIREASLKKIRDADPDFVEPDTGYPDNKVKKGDVAKIVFESNDYNSAHSEIAGKENYYEAEYSWLISGAVEKSIKIVQNLINNKREIDVNVKDENNNSTDSNGNSVEGEGILITSADKEKTDNVVVTAKDLAGNVATKNISVELKNSINPEKLSVELWAAEKNTLTDYAENSPMKLKERNSSVPDNSHPHFTTGIDCNGNKGKTFRIKLGNITDEITSLRVVLNGKRATKNIYISSIPEEQKVNNMFDLTAVIEAGQTVFTNGINRVVVYGYNDSGVETAPSDEAIIVVDTEFGNGVTVLNKMGGTAVLEGKAYKFKTAFTGIEELAGVGMARAVSLEGNNVKLDLSSSSAYGTKTVYGGKGNPIDVNGMYQIFTAANLNGCEFELENIPSVLHGTRAKLRVRVYDYLGNSKDILYEFLIPKRGINIKSQAAGSEKETRTKVKVVGENQFDLEKTEETGKKAK